MDMNFNAFQEPRGVMRILHLIFSICAFATITGYSGAVRFTCKEVYDFVFEYPFNLALREHSVTSFKISNATELCNATVTIDGNFSSDARFFVATGVLAMLYTICIIYVYAKMDEQYRTNPNIPMLDFIATVIFGVLWLSSSAAWANGLRGLKNVTDNSNIVWNISPQCFKCATKTTSFSSLNISVIFGFLNFFLWAADLWFLYKETVWFQNAQVTSTTAGV